MNRKYVNGWVCLCCGVENPDESSPCADTEECESCLAPRRGDDPAAAVNAGLHPATARALDQLRRAKPYLDVLGRLEARPTPLQCLRLVFAEEKRVASPPGWGNPGQSTDSLGCALWTYRELDGRTFWLRPYHALSPCS